MLVQSHKYYKNNEIIMSGAAARTGDLKEK